MVEHIENRDTIIKALREELVGPSPQGHEIDCSGDITFDDAEASYGPWRQQGSGEEILLRDPPTKRYGVGVLYPAGIPAEQAEAEAQTAPLPVEPSSGAPAPAGEDPLTEQAARDLEALAERASRSRRDGEAGAEAEADDFDLSAANAYKPSSMAISFLAAVPEGGTLVVNACSRLDAPCGRYKQKTVRVAGHERTWWLRSPVQLTARFSAAALRVTRESKVGAETVASDGLDGMQIEIEVFSRPRGNDLWLLTVCLVNRHEATGFPDGHCLFQAGFTAHLEPADGAACIYPYPEPARAQLDEEEESLALLYRQAQTFAVGHGCAADWGGGTGPERVAWVRAECLPAHETPSVTPEIVREDGTKIEVSMASLAGLVREDDGFAALDEVVERYAAWIRGKRGEADALDARYRSAARRHLDDCSRSAARMRDGLQYLKEDAQALRAFRLANRAILLQQVRTARSDPRVVQYDSDTGRIKFSEDYVRPNPLDPPGGRGQWRPFQVAFLLMSVRSTAAGDAPDRRTVELIWFPTGGGKTEAYLALTAFSLFLRRLKGPEDSGVHVLMRYTLRLLTAQQFQRASALLCAMEYLRRERAADLGGTPFTIGMWLGRDTTPNTRAGAIEALRDMQRDGNSGKNPFVLTRCPWCRAQLGRIEYRGRPPRNAPRVAGYERQGDTVVIKCPDGACEFAGGLPVYVIDEDIYDRRPSLVIGTVDKFATLAWRPEARSLFGIGWDGERERTPPGLIVQDELHLISGPLGSMVGLYEGVIEELCTDTRTTPPVPPKIVSSTATIRRYEAQIKALYARDSVVLFPPPGLDASDSFFARYARREDGTLQRGRIYVGVHAPGLGSLQTAQVRTFSALVQAPVPLPPAERDPWWTLVLFFNSLRELGTTLSLLQSDIPDYLKVIRNRMGLGPGALRRLWRILELTGRLESDEVPQAMADLEVKTTGERYPVDVCLASNIIEVGIDIDRLSVMAVVGQPKTTSQYIQVTGRIGRRWWERPGLVVTIYVASKPRDRSHFEKFRSYHERLYAQVEPTSVTPFAPPALDRALHAALASYVRQAGDRDLARSPYPYRGELVDELRDILTERVEAVDGDELENFQKVFDKRIAEWRAWQSTRWSGRPNDDGTPLLRDAGSWVSSEDALVSWPTPRSMRNVDAECEAQITRLYVLEGSNGSD